jgi:hypothetical protein
LAIFFAAGAQGFAALCPFGTHGLAALVAFGAQGFAACATVGSEAIATSPPSAAIEPRVRSEVLSEFIAILLWIDTSMSFTAEVVTATGEGIRRSR